MIYILNTKFKVLDKLSIKVMPKENKTQWKGCNISALEMEAEWVHLFFQLYFKSLSFRIYIN